MNHKHRVKRLRAIAFNAFVTLSFIVALILIGLMFGNASASYIPCNATDVMATEYIPNEADVTMLAKTIYGESRGIESITEQAAVAWCILNRVDLTGYGMGHSIKYVTTFPEQFQGYSPYHPAVDDFGRDLKALARDVLIRWMMERDGCTDVGRVLAAEYLWFSSDGHGHNVFRDAWRSKDAHRWDWNLPSPYEN